MSYDRFNHKLVKFTMNKIELTKCRAGFYYYFTATAQYLVKKEGNQWAFYKTVKGEIDGEALIVARTLALLKEALINFVDSEIDTQDNEPKIEDHSITSEATVTSEVEPVDSEIDSNSWFTISNKHCYEDEVVETYRDYCIALAIPNGGICGITIWNEDKSLVEAVDTEEYDKYCDEDWHIEQAKLRINQILSPANQLNLFTEPVDFEIDSNDFSSEQNEHSSEHLEWSDFHQAYLSVATGEVIISLEHNQDISKATEIVEVQQLTSNSVEEQITQNFNDNEPDGDSYLPIEQMEFTKRSKLCREDYDKYLELYPETQLQNEPDGDDLHYPPEIDSPDPDFDHDTPEVDYPDYSLMVAQVKKDIAEDEFLHKIPHYLKLLQVTREEFDSFVIADVDFDKIGDEDWMDENDESLYDITYEIDEKAVLNRLSQLYEKTDYQALLDKFKEENPHFTILESKFFTVPYWHLTEQKLLIFGYGGDGNKFHCYSVISFTKTRTNHIFDGNYQQSRLIYQEYCGNTANFKVYPPRQKDPILERYKQELTPDYRVFTRKQLALF